MKRLLVVLLLILAGPAWAASFDDGVEALQAQRFTDARAIFTPLAREGNGDAQFMLGVMHENGLGTAKDLEAAASWYEKAARAGVASAQYNLGIFHQLGTGVAHDLKKALEYHRRAAAQGHSRAQNNLGTMYYTGAGVLRNAIEAWKWFTLAARGLQGEAAEIARGNLAAIEGELTPDELAEAKRRAAAWQPEK